jgi:hypothetical protein
MNAQQLQADSMQFLLILSKDNYIRITNGISLRALTIMFSTLMLIIELLFLYLSYNIAIFSVYNMSWLIAYHFTLVALWPLMLVGPLTQKFNICLYSIQILEVCTFIEYVLKASGSIYIFIQLPAYDHTYVYLILLSVLVYLFLWTLAVYFYFSYTKTLGLGLLTNEVNQLIVESSSYVAPNTEAASLIVIPRPTITLTHLADIAFARESQNSVVNSAVLPSGTVVPSGVDGKYWKVVGNCIILT